MMSVEQSVKWELVGENEVLWESTSQCHFVHHKLHMNWLGLLEPGKPATNRLSYGTPYLCSVTASLSCCPIWGRSASANPERERVSELCVGRIWEQVFLHYWSVEWDVMRRAHGYFKAIFQCFYYCEGRNKKKSTRHLSYCSRSAIHDSKWESSECSEGCMQIITQLSSVTTDISNKVIFTVGYVTRVIRTRRGDGLGN
jgi:hypothetical protein